MLGLVLSLVVSGCGGVSEMEPVKMTPEMETDLRAIAASKIYFGHQSVGGNIIDGLKDLQGGAETPLRIAVLGDLALPEQGGILIHTAIGKNEEPVSKCEDFRRILSEELKGRVDIALLKFCYVDFNEDTDVAQVFEVYRDTLETLKRENPETLFIHVTAPLRHTASGLGVWAREILGRPNRSKLANMRRNEFNRMLEETFLGDPIFDLAASQSTYPDGTREYFTKDGETYYSLIAEYTNDGGHLNAIGRTRVAADFVHAIAVAVEARGSKSVAALNP
jgi:hypothetical protein